jgi:hypothetical protein
MKRHLAWAAAIWAGAIVGASAADGASWIFQPSAHTHDPATGKRVVQYAQPKARPIPTDSTYKQSVYRHNRSAVRGGDSADRLHMVETWGQGDPVRPYGEWLRPYRAGATPYGPWGSPQGPWTTPDGAWTNPYGLLPRLPWNAWPYGSPGFWPEGLRDVLPHAATDDAPAPETE